MVLKFLLEKEFKQAFRNPIILGMMLGYPLLMLLVLPWAVTFDLKDLRVTVVDHDKSPLGQELVGKIGANRAVKSIEYAPTYPLALERVQRGEADLIVEIPRDFGRDVATEGSPTILLAPNGTNATQGLLAANLVTQIVRELGANIETRVRPKPAETLSLHAQYLFNPALDYKTFMLPAFVVLMVTLLCGILPTLNIVQEKELGTIQQINVTPIKPWQFIVAKIIPYYIIGLVNMVVAIAIIGLLYGLWPNGSLWGILLAGLIFIPTIAALGLIVSNYSQLMQQAMFIMMFFILIILLISGLFTPVEAMPTWAQWIARINPLSYFIDAMRRFYLYRATIADMWHNYLWLGVQGMVAYTWAILSYKKVDA